LTSGELTSGTRPGAGFDQAAGYSAGGAEATIAIARRRYGASVAGTASAGPVDRAAGSGGSLEGGRTESMGGNGNRVTAGSKLSAVDGCI